MIRFSQQFYPEGIDNPELSDFKLARLREMASATSTLREMIALARRILEGLPQISPEEFTDGQWLSGDQKRKVLKQWRSFVVNGFPERLFTGALYEHLHLHCGYIAHYDKRGFFCEYWGASDLHRFAEETAIAMRPVPLAFSRWESFLRQFTIWGEYADINTAMLATLAEELEALVKDILLEAQQHMASDIAHSYELYLQAKSSMTDRAAALRKEADDLDQTAEALTHGTCSDGIGCRYAELFGEELASPEKAVSQLALI